MQPEYLARLSPSVREFVHEVEEAASINIEVFQDPSLNQGGPTGQGNLAVVIKADRVQIFIPTNGYFPNGAVRHEVLHVHRFHVENVPKLALTNKEIWNEGIANVLTGLDNAIEHIVIVPIELQLHPERRRHWEAMMHSICVELPHVPEEELNLAFCLHWTFLRVALPNSPQIEIARKFAIEHSLLEEANNFADQLLSVADSKEQMVRLLCSTFPEIPKHRAALEYINSKRGTWQVPIP